MISQDNTNIFGWQKSFLWDLREHLVGIVEDISEAEKDEDVNEINFQLYSLFASFDGEYRDLHETGRNFTGINRENLMQAAQMSLSYSTFLGNVLIMTAQILDGALKSKDYSHVIGQFDSQIMRPLN